MTCCFLPEGRLLHTPENIAACARPEALSQAMAAGTVLEGSALLCDENHDLLVSLGPFTGRIPRAETAIGIAEGTTRDIAILSRVGKPVSLQWRRWRKRMAACALSFPAERPRRWPWPPSWIPGRPEWWFQPP